MRNNQYLKINKYYVETGYCNISTNRICTDTYFIANIVIKLKARTAKLRTEFLKNEKKLAQEIK